VGLPVRGRQSKEIETRTNFLPRIPGRETAARRGRARLDWPEPQQVKLGGKFSGTIGSFVLTERKKRLPRAIDNVRRKPCRPDGLATPTRVQHLEARAGNPAEGDGGMRSPATFSVP